MSIASPNPAQAHEIFSRLNRVIFSVVAEPRVTWPSSLADMAKRMAELDPARLLQDLLGHSIQDELDELREKIKALNAGLNQPDKLVERDEAKALSSRVIELKRRLHDKRQEFDRLRLQKKEQAEILESLELQLGSARDLLRLTAESVGLPQSVECPTCHQEVSPETASLKIHDTEEIRRTIDALKAERTALRRASRRLETEIQATRAFMDDTQLELSQANQELALVQSAVGRDREADVGRLVEILQSQRRVDKLEQVAQACERLSEEIGAWNRQHAEYAEGRDAAQSDAETSRIEAYRRAVFQWLKQLRHCEVEGAGMTESDLYLDESYRARVDGRLLTYTGAGSDRARLVLAHVLAAQECSAGDMGHHPGFVLLDEPLQQNPDPVHRQAVVEAFSTSWTVSEGQRIVLTQLTDTELAALEKAGTPLLVLEGRFLRALDDESRSDC